MISFNSFCEMAKAYVKDHSGDSEVTVVTNKKNNGLVLTGITVKEPGENVSAVIYLNEWYMRHEEDGLSLDDAFDGILEEVKEARRDAFKIDPHDILDYDRVKKNLGVKVINAAMNENMLGECPHARFLDLAAVPVVIIWKGKKEAGTATVKNDQLSVWGKTGEEVMEDALKNMHKALPITVIDPSEVVFAKEVEMKDIMGRHTYRPGDAFIPPNGNIPFVCVSNELGLYGASCLYCDEGLFAAMAKAYDANLIVIPSSVHEVLVIPELYEGHYEESESMPKGVNEGYLRNEEVLSDSAYFYSKELGVLQTLAEKRACKG